MAESNSTHMNLFKLRLGISHQCAFMLSVPWNVWRTTLSCHTLSNGIEHRFCVLFPDRPHGATIVPREVCCRWSRIAVTSVKHFSSSVSLSLSLSLSVSVCVSNLANPQKKRGKKELQWQFSSWSNWYWLTSLSLCGLSCCSILDGPFLTSGLNGNFWFGPCESNAGIGMGHCKKKCAEYWIQLLHVSRWSQYILVWFYRVDQRRQSHALRIVLCSFCFLVAITSLKIHCKK